MPHPLSSKKSHWLIIEELLIVGVPGPILGRERRLAIDRDVPLPVEVLFDLDVRGDVAPELIDQRPLLRGCLLLVEGAGERVDVGLRAERAAPVATSTNM